MFCANHDVSQERIMWLFRRIRGSKISSSWTDKEDSSKSGVRRENRNNSKELGKTNMCMRNSQESWPLTE